MEAIVQIVDEPPRINYGLYTNGITSKEDAKTWAEKRGYHMVWWIPGEQKLFVSLEDTANENTAD